MIAEIERVSMRFISGLLNRSIILPECSFVVPSEKTRFLERSKAHLLGKLLKYWKRLVYMKIWQTFYPKSVEHQSIPVNAKRILWINLSAPSLGDSLMDLSARSLLSDRDITLLTRKKNQLLYVFDHYFTRVLAVEDLCEESFAIDFDFVLLDSFSPHILRIKSKIAPDIPFAGLYGFLNGFEVHRTYFAFARMMELLAIDQVDVPRIPTISLPDELLDQDDEIDVCIAIGGEWSFRTYDHWMPVVSHVTSRGYSISLVGSGNGAQKAAEIFNEYPSVRSTVGKLSVREVILEISRARVFIGADGGLWHIACALQKPTVVLFADCQIFGECGNRMTRETEDMTCETLYDDRKVSSIPSNSVIEAFDRLSRRINLSG